VIKLGNGLPPNFSGKKMLNEKNASTIPRVSGVYRIFDKKGKGLYMGVSKKGETGNLRHRIQSYYQKDNFNGTAGHPEKKELRKKAKKFDFAKMSNYQMARKRISSLRKNMSNTKRTVR
jgi:excinuclease UvrABC nuclease subunit